MYLSSRETLTRQDWGKKTLGDFFQNERELDNLDWGNSQKKLKIFGLTISRAREFEQMQEFPPPHFFSPINFGGSHSPRICCAYTQCSVDVIYCVGAKKPVQYWNEVFLCARQCQCETELVCVSGADLSTGYPQVYAQPRSGATFVPFRVSRPPP